MGGFCCRSPARESPSIRRTPPSTTARAASTTSSAGNLASSILNRCGRARPTGSSSWSPSFPTRTWAQVSDALFAAGAGRIGEYTECSFRLAGKGTFFATDATNPTVGQKGRRESVEEWRLEVVVPEPLIGQAVEAMRQAHRYEEPAFDVYPLRAGTGGGEGRIGELATAVKLGELVERAKRELSAASVQVVGDLSQSTRKVAIACGAAGEYLVDSIRSKADVFLTGEMRFHDALCAREAGVNVILPGHYATERPAVLELAAKIAAEWPGAVVWASRVECDPLASA